MKKRKKREPLTIDRLERALLIAARCIELDGAVHLPIFQRLERELEAMKQTDGTQERARQRLEANRHHRLVDVGLKAKS